MVDTQQKKPLLIKLTYIIYVVLITDSEPINCTLAYVFLTLINELGNFFEVIRKVTLFPRKCKYAFKKSQKQAHWFDW